MSKTLTADGYQKVNGKWTKDGHKISFSISDPIPYSDYYTGANAKELQREHFDLLEQGSSPTQGSQPQGSQPTEGQRPSRLAELNTMSANATGDYYAGDNAKGLQREHLQLLEAQADAAPDGGTHGA